MQLTRYLGRRALQAVPVLIGVTVIGFILVRVAPGDPTTIMLGTQATPQAIETLQHQLGLDRSLPAQYGEFVKDGLTLDFGESFTRRVGVRGLIAERILPTIWLLGYAIVLSLLLAVPLALLAALRRNRFPDHVTRILTMITFAMPSFWLGLLLILVFSLKLGWLPTSGYGTSALDHFKALILPALTLALYLAPLLLRTLRSSMIESLSADFVEAARARGLRTSRLLRRYVLLNSLTATITVLGVHVGYLLSGAVVVEAVFAIPGLGSLLVASVDTRDFPVIQALVLTFAVLVIMINVLTDLTYAIIDPRVRL